MKKRILLAAFAALALATALPTGAMADTACTVTVTKFHQSYPYSGKATVEYTVGGTLPPNAVAEIVIKTDDASATFTQSSVVAGANTNVIDFASFFGGALVLTNASFLVTIGCPGVQLWENGPYWAECNVGASAPEESGYYFWWGDTVGYTNTGRYGWISVKDGTWFMFSNDPALAGPTYGKSVSALQSEGWIDASGNLAPEHDAATAHLGAQWRMPTDAEFSALLSNCTTTWTTRNGVHGRLVKGKYAYADMSIFLPAAGYGTTSGTSELLDAGSAGYYWSSTPYSGDSALAWDLNFDLSNCSVYYFAHNGRQYGHSVRPVRRFAECSAGGSVTYDLELAVNVTKFHQSYPYSGKATVEYTVGGALPPCAVAEFTISTDDASATFVQENIVAGANTNVIDFASSFGGALVLTNASFFVTIGRLGVQLWENGPYWAECNVGASKPEEYGYHFWWGDTVGYTNTGSGWISVADGTGISFTNSNTAASTCDKSNSALQSEGWIDATGNLVAEHDAAHVHWGGEWRMPTRDEVEALVSNCTATKTTINGVSGHLVRGTGAYADRSIFLPAAGYGDGSGLDYPGVLGYYWSSTPNPGNSSRAWNLYLHSGFDQSYNNRFVGLAVRPVRRFAE